MTRLAIIIILLTIGIFASGQDCKTFQDYKRDGQKISDLDSAYPSAIHVDTTIAVFYGREKEFYGAWVSLLQDLAQHLADNGFLWGNPTWCFNRVYFNKYGKINTFLFNFKTSQVDEDKQDTFTALLTSFAKDYKLKINGPAESNFSQCGPATYMDKG